MFLPGSICLSVCQQDYTKSLQAIFVKSFRIMDYRYGKDTLIAGFALPCLVRVVDTTCTVIGRIVDTVCCDWLTCVL